MPLPDDISLRLITSTDDVRDFMEWLDQPRRILGVDTETTGLSPERDRIRLVQFGDKHIQKVQRLFRLRLQDKLPEDVRFRGNGLAHSGGDVEPSRKKIPTFEKHRAPMFRILEKIGQFATDESTGRAIGDDTQLPLNQRFRAPEFLG